MFTGSTLDPTHDECSSTLESTRDKFALYILHILDHHAQRVIDDPESLLRCSGADSFRPYRIPTEKKSEKNESS